MDKLKPDLFDLEEKVQKEAEDLILSGKYADDPLLEHYRYLADQYAKILREVKKIVKISDGQQEYLHHIQEQLNREIGERIKAEEKLKTAAALDSLTGIYNRGTGLALLESQLKAFERDKTVFSICYLDINSLKYVNDNFSHLEGDELLITTCRFIRKAIRENDILCRLGGDEFLVIFPNCAKENADEVLERITESIDRENQSHTRPYDISFSYGIVQIDENSVRSIDELIESADKKMYEHKLQFKRRL